jgi:hypothetical protein
MDLGGLSTRQASAEQAIEFRTPRWERETSTVLAWGRGSTQSAILEDVFERDLEHRRHFAIPSPILARLDPPVKGPPETIVPRKQRRQLS